MYKIFIYFFAPFMAGLIPDYGHLDLISRHFKALGEPSRLLILDLLHRNGELNVQELMEASGLRQANLSKHLGILLETGILKRRKEGVMAFYSIQDKSVQGLCLLAYNRLMLNRRG
ncbi:MAG TPA: metalloregulator ArsR/SmtB family transcription factor [Rhodothermales bacterium]|nr:metalloregulator ArsR/SmtB family transcription factor [Rhodothermales bacterium]HRR07211.1 metalloregulator ArsR/SmtB family transcription factor [Rhodothermales bacterium]